MKKLLFILPLLAFILGSCTSSEPKNEITMNRMMVNRITTLSSGDISMKSCMFTYNVDLVGMKIIVTIPNLRLDGSDKSLKLEIPQLPLSASSSTGYTFKSDDIVPLVDGVANPEYKITNLSGTIFDAEISTSFIIGGKYRVNAMLAELTYPFSQTTVVGGGDPFTWKEAQYVLNVSASEKTATLYIYNIKFASGMPVTLAKMEAKGIKIEPTAGGYSLSADKIVPNNNGTPFEAYTITGLSGTLIGESARIQFLCGGKFTVTVDATMHKREE